MHNYVRKSNMQTLVKMMSEAILYQKPDRDLVSGKKYYFRLWISGLVGLFPVSGPT